VEHTASLTGEQLSAIPHREADRSAPVVTASANLVDQSNQAQLLWRELTQEHQHRVTQPEASVPDDIREVGASRPAAETARSAADQDAADSELSFADRLARAMHPELDAPEHRPAEQTVPQGHDAYGPQQRPQQQEQGRGHRL
jgi:hypothetical protein